MKLRRTALVLSAVASALVTAALVPGWADAGPAAPATSALARTALAVVDTLPAPGTAWGLDAATGRLVVTVSGATPAADVTRLIALAGRFGDAVRIVHSARPLVEQDLIGPALLDGLLLGGDEIADGRVLCSAGFNVLRDGQPYVLTAGHCTAGLPAWQNVGPSVVSAFPGTDYGLIENTSAISRGDVDRYDGSAQPIIAAGTPYLGEPVCASGRTTGLTCGTITGIDQTVDYGDGDVVRGLIETNVHTDRGDSGGSLFDGTTALGTVSGGDGTTDYFQPVAPVLAAQGLTLEQP